MVDKKYLKFAMDINKKKPNNIINKNVACPFCNKEGLKDILYEEGPIIWLKNKYPVLEDTLQTVLIESDVCDSNISFYTEEHMRNLISFGVKKWLELERTGTFKSVIFYKNHGPYSGGSIKHPHMQIVGLKDVDYRECLNDYIFEGIPIYESPGCLVNLSNKPQAGFTEFNVIIDSLDNLNFMADSIQKTVTYILNHFPFKCNSFNLFFYEWNNKIICKVVPRFITSPLFIGFSISQVSNQMDKIVEDIIELFFK